MFLIKGHQVASEGWHHVFVDERPEQVPDGWQLHEGVTLTAHPLSDDPDAPTVKAVLYQDPAAPDQYHYLLSKEQAKHLRRVGGSPYVYDTWDEFAQLHPTVVEKTAG